MATMDPGDIDAVHANHMRELSRLLENIPGCVKGDLRAAAVAIDQWISDNAISFNSALPQPFRGAASTPQKVRLFVLILERRFKLGT